MANIDMKKDPAAMQTAAGFPLIADIDTSFVFTDSEKDVLRNLAKKVSEIASRPEMKAKAELWTAHNDLKTDRPLVFIDPENGWNEMIPSSQLECHDPLARVWEMSLRKKIYWADILKDDRVIDDWFDVQYCYAETGWGIESRLTDSGGNGGAYHIEKALSDYEQDFEKLHPLQIVLDEKQSADILSLAHDVFDGILKVRRKNTWWWTLGLCYDYIFLRGLEDFMCDCITDPEWVHKMFDFLCESKLSLLDYLEENNLLASNVGNTYVGSGGFGYTDEIEFKENNVTTKDMWGFCDAQETAQMHPDMYGEFVLPYHKRILSRFGLSCYGCCEGYHNRWKYVKTLPNLRRVSVSPWADWKTVPEYLGKDYIASVKPSPAPLADSNMDENVVRKDCANAASETKGGICEFIMKDNNTLGGCPENATRWVEIMRQEIDRIY